MEAYISKAQFLETQRATHAEWEALLAEVGEARMTEPGAAGEWSIKDVVAHVTWGEREMLQVLRSHVLAGSDLWQRPQDARNAAVYAEHRSRSLPNVLDEAREVYAQLFAALQAVSEADLNDPRRFREMPEDWIPWQVVAGNTYLHYQEHMPAIRAWLDGHAADGRADEHESRP